MPGRKYNGGDYRFGFNGKENDNEIKGDGNSVDFGTRMYDPRLGKFKSLDPLFKDNPSKSNYMYAGDIPLYLIDVNGEFKYPADKEAHYRKTYPIITKYLELQIVKDIISSSKII